MRTKEINMVLSLKSVAQLTWIVLGLLLFLTSCNDKSFNTGDDVMLRFSLDTLRFDTVFTELGSATRSFRVFNDNDQSVLISEIVLADDMQGSFRLNIDGLPVNAATDIEILPKDSLWIFAEVTIDPDNPLSVSPFILEDRVLFKTNGNDQLVRLEAWGQNANYIPSRFSDGDINLVSSCNFDSLIWDDPKPYVIYGVLLIDSCHLVLPPGTDVYIHGGVVSNQNGVYNDGILGFLPNGTLVSRGTLDNPVTIQGDRLEAGFQGIAGQWGGVRFFPESKGNIVKHTIISNGIVGLRADSLAQLEIESSQVRNSLSGGVIGVNADVKAKNSLFEAIGGFGVACVHGGNYDFEYCTIPSYGNDSEALRLDNFQCYDQFCSNWDVKPLDASFTNCIVMGTADDEISMTDFLDGENPSMFKYSLSNCIVKVEELLEIEQFPGFFGNCNPCINASNSDTLFVNPSDGDYHLDSLSIAEMEAIPITEILRDIEGNLRDNVAPDIGCYEYQY